MEKKLLLSCSECLNVEYIDGEFIDNLLQSNNYFLLIESCALFTLLKDNSRLFGILIKFILKEVNYKDISISYLTTLIFDQYKNAGFSELNNLRKLYENIEDEEIQRELIAVIKRIQKHSPNTIDEFAKSHKLKCINNGCYYFVNINEINKDYDAIELLPLQKILQYDYDLDGLKILLEDISYAGIIPKTKFEYDSGQKEVSIKYIHSPKYNELSETSFNHNESDILLALELIENIYKKAIYFFRKFGKFPHISIDNILVDLDSKEIHFKKIGTILCPVYFLKERTLRNDDNNDIPLMISLLVKELFFQSKEDEIKLFMERSKIGMELFLSNCLSRMSSREPFNRYKHSRFEFLLKHLKLIDIYNTYEVSNLYFKERLKVLLARENDEAVNWQLICNSVKELYFELAKTYDEINFDKIIFFNKTFFNLKLPKNLHYLSRMLLNISLNSRNIFNNDSKNDSIKLLNLLNYFVILCVETVSFLKSRIDIPKRMSSELSFDKMITIKANGLSQNYNIDDVNTIQVLRNKEANNQTIFDPSINFTLKQISGYYLIRNFTSKIEGNSVYLNNESVLNDKTFGLLIYNLLIRLPRIEEIIYSQIKQIIIGLKTNQDFTIIPDTANLEAEILSFCKEINKSRIKFKLNRHYGYTNLSKWPPIIYLKRLFRRRYKSTNESMDKVPLSNLFPTSKSKCSWDVNNKEVFNLVIPNERINLLIKKLTEGKKFGYKIKYLYSERAKIIWDVVLLTIITIFFLEIDHKLSDLILGLGILFLVGKIIIDFRFWSDEISKIIEYIKT